MPDTLPSDTISYLTQEPHLILLYTALIFSQKAGTLCICFFFYVTLADLSLVNQGNKEYNYGCKTGDKKLLPPALSIKGGVIILEDMIAKIVEMDKKARDMTDEAQQNKLDYEQHILRKKERIKNDYLERAKKRIVEERDSAVIKELENTYAKNGDKWVESIVAGVTDG